MPKEQSKNILTVVLWGLAGALWGYFQRRMPQPIWWAASAAMFCGVQVSIWRIAREVAKMDRETALMMEETTGLQRDLAKAQRETVAAVASMRGIRPFLEPWLGSSGGSAS